MGARRRLHGARGPDGHVFAQPRGRNPEAAPVMTGSHADSQPTGGRYDGIYGVLGGASRSRAR